METQVSPNIRKKRNPFSWLLWWKLDDEELVKQVTQYDSLKIYQSASGVSSLLLCFSAIVTTLLVIFADGDAYLFIDVLVTLIFAILVYLKFRWAMVGAMIFWTFEKVVTFFSGVNPVVSVLWWAMFLHQFYLALKVENLHKDMIQNSPTSTSTPPQSTIS